MLAGYSRTDLVERRGEFAVRGGILDVFPPTSEHPARTEFWGDTVEQIRPFAVADQRSLEGAEPLEELWAPVCRELVLTESVRERAQAVLAEHPELDEILGKLIEGVAVEGMEALAPLLTDGMESILDVLEDDAMVLVCEPERVRTRAHDLLATSNEFLQASWLVAADGGTAPIDLADASYRSLADIREQASELGLPWWSTSSFGADDELPQPTTPTRSPPGWSRARCTARTTKPSSPTCEPP